MEAPSTLHENLRAVAGALRAGRDAILGLDQQTEVEFAALGTALSQVMNLIGEMVETCERQRCLMSGQDAKQALVFSYQLFKKFADLANAGLERGDIWHQLGNVAEELRKLSDQEESLSSVVSSCRMLKVAFREEAATLSEAEKVIFIDLAARMESVYDNLSSLVRVQFAHLAEAGTVLREVDRHMGLVQDASRAGVGAARLQIEANLKALDRALEPVMALSARISGELANARALASQVIVALQYQDIVRQKVEHVATSIQGVLATLEAPTSDAAGGICIDNAPALHHWARVQSEQLRVARGEIERAGSGIVEALGSLGQVCDRLLNMGKEVQRIGTDGLMDSRAAASFQFRFQELHRDVAVGMNSAVEEVRTDVLRKIGGIVDELSAEVVRLVEGLRVVAINGRIQSARIAGGGVLAQLAALTTSQSQEARRISEGLLGGVRSVVGKVEHLQTNLDDFVGLSAKEEMVLSLEANTAGRYLEEMRLEVEQGFDGMERALSHVRARTSELVRTLKFPGYVESSFGAVEAALRDVVQLTAASAATQIPSGDVGALLGDLRNSYTMERERALHDELVTGLGQTQPPGDPAGPVADRRGGPERVEEDLGDNVELF